MSYQSLPPEFIKTIAEHNIKIANVELITTNTNVKLSELLVHINDLKIALASSRDLEPRVKDLEKKTADLVASKNKIVGAITIGTILGTIVGVVGTWVVEILTRFKH